jgi:hypothetical protein
MKLFITTWLFLIMVVSAFAQKQVDRVKFFTDTAVVNATLSINYKHVLAQKDKIGARFPALFSCKLDDGAAINDHISVEVRGHFRRKNCDMPPLKLIYKKDPSDAFYKFKELKLVGVCSPVNLDEQYLIKEYLTYKIYNLINDTSFRVRLLNLTYQDSSGKRKMFTRHAFLIEDVKQVAKRLDCSEWSRKAVQTEHTNRQLMTTVNIFEYMIGNTDWSVPADHNIKLIQINADSTARPLPVPYDFDWSGLVNAKYAVPDEQLGTESVRDRVYRGYTRTMDELNAALDVFRKQKSNIYAVINNCGLLYPTTKKEMTTYLDQFYQTISKQENIQRIFVDNARKVQY